MLTKSGQISFSTNDEYVKVTFSKALQENDVIAFTSGSGKQIAIAVDLGDCSTSGTNPLSKAVATTTSYSYTVGSTDVSLIGATTLYFGRGEAGGTTIKGITITRPTAPSKSSACQLTSVQFSNTAYGSISALSNGAGKVTVPYMGTTAPTVDESSIVISEKATKEVSGNTITVTAEDGTTKGVYTITAKAITPLEVTADIATTDITAVPSWVYNPYGYEYSDSKPKGLKFAKADESDGTMRIALGNTRQYYFLSAAKTLTLTSGAINSRAINVYVNGTKLSSPTATVKSGSISISLDQTQNNMVCIESNQKDGDGGFTKYAITAVPSCTAPTIEWETAPANGMVGDADMTASVTTNQSGASVTWTSSDENVATVANGTIHYVAAGKTTITAKYTGSGDYCADEVKVEKEITVTAAKTYYSVGSTSGAKVTFKDNDYEVFYLINKQFLAGSVTGSAFSNAGFSIGTSCGTSSTTIDITAADLLFKTSSSSLTYTKVQNTEASAISFNIANCTELQFLSGVTTADNVVVTIEDSEGNKVSPTTAAYPSSSNKKGTLYTATLDATKKYSVDVRSNSGSSRNLVGFALKMVDGRAASDLTIKSGKETIALNLDGTKTYTLAKDVDYTTSSTGTLSYKSNGESVATVDNTGLITGVGLGSTTITISQVADENYKAGSKDFTVNVTGNPTVTFDDFNNVVGNNVDLTTKFTSNSNGSVSFTITDAGTTGATIDADGKTFSATAAGTAKVKASQVADGNYNSYEKGITVTVTAAAVKYAITYAETKGADMSAYPTEYEEGKGVASFAALADVTGYHFTGWEPASIDAAATGDKTITAQWEEVNWLIRTNVTGQTTYTVDGNVSGLTSANGGVNNLSSSATDGGYKLNGEGAYVQVTLPDGQYFQAGDKVIAYCTKTGGKMSVFSGTSDDDFIGGNTDDWAVGENTYVLPSTLKTNTKSIYLSRTSTYTQNPYIKYLKVVRPSTYAVNYSAGEGSGTMPSESYLEDTKVTLAVSTFDAPMGKVFDKWTSTDVTIADDNTFTMPAKNVTVTATYNDIPAPVITANDINIDADATSGEITYDIENPVSGVELTAEKTAGDWVSNVAVDATNKKVTFSATANTGDERTATITLKYTGATDKVVTVTQAAYVAPSDQIVWKNGSSFTGCVSDPSTATTTTNYSTYAISNDKMDRPSSVGDVWQLTISAKTGYVIKSICAYGKVEESAGADYSWDGGTTWKHVDAYSEGKKEYDDAPATGASSFMIKYTCTSTSAGGIYWRNAYITLDHAAEAAPSVSIPATANATTAVESTIDATISAYPAVSEIKWYSCDANKENAQEVSGQNTATLTYTPAAAGTLYYYCTAKNSVNTTASNLCTVTVADAPKSAECRLTEVLMSNGMNALIDNTAHTVKAYYMQGEAAPTVSSHKQSDKASYAESEGKITVTAENGTDKQDYTFTIEAVAPYTTIGETTITAAVDWVKGTAGINSNKGNTYELLKSDESDGKYRIELGQNRAYIFVGPCKDVTILNNNSNYGDDRKNSTYAVNGGEKTTLTLPKYNSNGSSFITIPCDEEKNNMIEIVNAGNGSWGFGKVTLTKAYAITCQNAQNGSVKASEKKATKGTTITLTVTPDEGYELNTLEVKDVNEQAVELTGYQFTMPESDVTVTATFRAEPVYAGMLIKAEFKTSTTADVSGTPGGTADVSLSSGGKLDSEKYFGVKLDGGHSFKKGDVVTISLTSGGSSNDWCAFNSKTASDATKIYSSTTGGKDKELSFTLDSDQPAIYFVRNSTYTWNPTFGSITVSRTYHDKSTITLGGENSQGYWGTYSNDHIVFIQNADVNRVPYSTERNTVGLSALPKEVVTIDGNDVEGTFLPANTGVLIHSTESANVTAWSVNYKAVDAVQSNYMRPVVTSITADEMNTKDANSKFYMLSYDDYTKKNDLGFYWGAANGAAFAISKAHVAYLAIPTSNGNAPVRFVFSQLNVPGEATGIDENAASTGSATNGQKVLRNGQIYILRGGRTYNVNGQLVK